MLPILEGLKVYLVEPSTMQGALIRGKFAKRGVHDTTLFGNATEMLGRCRIESPDLIVSALYLPDINGIDLIARLRADSVMADIPFILISSETRPQVLDPVRQGGVCGILPKPFSDAQLDMALGATLDYLRSDVDLEIDDVDLGAVQVLLVDDSLSARRFARRILENLGIRRITEANDGSQAVPMLMETPFDLVVTDYNMPDVSGQGLLEFIRTCSWQASIPVIMVTSESDMSRLAAVEAAGVSGICDKPLDARTLRTLLRNILGSQN